MAQFALNLCLAASQRPRAFTSMVFSSSTCFKASEGDEPGTITQTETDRANARSDYEGDPLAGAQRSRIHQLCAGQENGTDGGFGTPRRRRKGLQHRLATCIPLPSERRGQPALFLLLPQLSRRQPRSPCPLE